MSPLLRGVRNGIVPSLLLWGVIVALIYYGWHV
jgi:hypothetical protein